MVFWIALALGAACTAPTTRIGLAQGVPEGEARRSTSGLSDNRSGSAWTRGT